MSKSTFQEEINKILAPKLLSLGFKKVGLKGCMHYEVLYNKDRLWFGTSWDFRDLYLEVNLGHLYWFKDVMPRVIILGDYISYCSKLKSLSVISDQFFSQVAEIIQDSIKQSLSIYEDRYDRIIAEAKNPKSLRYAAEFFSHLGNEVSWAELQSFMK